jgi:hypothetical protein
MTRQLFAVGVVSAIAPFCICLAPRTTKALEPATMLAVSSAASGVLSFFGRKPDLTLTVVMENYKLLLEVHNRLDAIEESVGSILDQLAKLPAINRQNTADQLDFAEFGAILNAPETLAIELGEDGVLATHEERESVRERLVLLRESVDKLRGRPPANVALALAAAASVELAFREALAQPPEKLDDVRNSYRDLLRTYLSPADAYSVTSLLNTLTADNDKRRAKLLKELKLTSIPNENVVLPWYAYVLQKKATKYVETRCPPPIKTLFQPHNSIYPDIFPVNFLPKMHIEEPLVAAYSGPCFGPVQYTKDVKSKCFWQELSVLPLEFGEIQLTLRSINQIHQPCKPRPDVPRKLGQKRAEAYEKEQDIFRAKFVADTLEIFNATSRALSALKAIQNVLERTLTWLDSYKSQDIQLLIEARAVGFSVANYLSELREVENSAEAQRLTAFMRQRRQAAHATIAETRDHIQDVVQDQKKQEALGRITVALRIINISLQAYLAGERLVGELSNQQDAGTTSQEKDATKNSVSAASPDGASLPARQDGTGGERGDTSAEKSSDSVSESREVPSGGPGPKLDQLPPESRSPAERMRYVYDVVERLRRSRDRSNASQPEELTAEEREGYRALAILGGLDDSDADDLADTLNENKTDAAKEIIDGVIKDAVLPQADDLTSLPGPLAAFAKAMTPEVIAPATLIDREARLSAQRQLTGLLLERLQKRHPDVLGKIIIPEPESEVTSFRSVQ